MDVSKGLQALSNSSITDLPVELLNIITSSRRRNSFDTEFLEIVANTSLTRSDLTLRLFTSFEEIWADTCARWSSPRNDKLLVTEAFARILPFAPHLSIYFEQILTSYTPPKSKFTLHIPYLSENTNEPTTDIPAGKWQRILLAAYRLLRFDINTFSQTISTPLIQDLLSHGDRGVRYLAIRILCILLNASDSKLEEMIAAHVGAGKQEAILGLYDGDLIDLQFLSLFEERRRRVVLQMRAEVSSCSATGSTIAGSSLSRRTLCHGSVLLPRPQGPVPTQSALISTASTLLNLQSLTQALKLPDPVLVHGLSGSGKTSLVNDLARDLGQELVTLHLNEQTDAKMLMGMYTASKPGSFTWRAGVLTTAVREGRWVFIEDLDRAPNDVISVLLSLIEKGELFIPSRGETIKAARGFRIVATIRTTMNMSGHENPPALHMLGSRLWNRVPVKMAPLHELEEIIDGLYPILRKFLPGVMAVYNKLYMLSQNSAFASKSKTSLGRPISPRDLLKWCRRLEGVLVASAAVTGLEPITEATQNDMFMEAADCFASSLQTAESRKIVVMAIAEEMQIPPQRVDHYMEAHIPRYQESETSLQIGRVKLAKRAPAGRVAKVKKSRPFANTKHAKRLLEQVGVALKMAEPVLLVGETGIGKTTVIQQLADSMSFKLIAVNLSQQSEVGDLLGGFKPVNIRSLAVPLKEEFEDLFAATGISAHRNQKYLESVGKCIAKSQWKRASKLWREAPKMFDRIISELETREADNAKEMIEQPTKRRKTESKLHSLLGLRPRWNRFSTNLDQFDVQISGGEKGFAFTFVEGNIIKAVRNGDWVLLDEINLASPDTLEAIADLLHNGGGGSPSILLSETGEIERIRAHPNFRIFGAMNPATDVGKRDLPMGLRSRFTEIYVESPDRNLDDLLAVIEAYLKSSSSSDKRAAHDVAQLYLNTKRLADQKRLVDGANQIPHFSLRTLTRVLSYVNEIAPSYGLRRALFEGYAMGFLTLLDRESELMLMPLIYHHLLDSHGNPQALLAQSPKHPDDGKQYVKFTNKKRDRQYWMLQGYEPPQEQPHYIITPFVERNMLNLVRATSTRRFPVLVQGPTSAGKTSMIEYLAKFSGNKFVRINNHEHTDLQEYLGTYVSGSDGQLHFQEGLLIQALRQGHWIVLDELNLAPTDVLEALNRLLDDNRELLIPETQEIVRPHENFMLFATQNPPGLYGGRKTLSRAFRNRFLELHFDDIPEDELEFILQHRSQKTAPSDCKRIVLVYKELSRLRQSSRLFEQKDSFATLRDLFRWALRDADTREQLAANGYMLLAERVRKPEERTAVKEIIEQIMKVKIDLAMLYSAATSPEIKLYESTTNMQGVVWTQAMRRLYVLVSHALRNNEPVLLVGETGCGKTTVCQMLAEAFGKELHIVNAHQNTETGDLIGAQRPVRNRIVILKELEDDLLLAQHLYNSHDENTIHDLNNLVAEYRSLSPEKLSSVSAELQTRITGGQAKARALFEWSDGSLVQAMKEAQYFLLDEISLADDSVLERLNSVLEPQRTILLAEKGITDSFVQAADGFQFFATMNPGGDYGKRELSPALRNRFTEIWVPSLSEHQDVLQIIETKLRPTMKPFANAMVDFAEWFGQTYRSSSSQTISVRDILAWVHFINGYQTEDDLLSFLHGAAMVYIDTLGANPAALLAINPENIQGERRKCLEVLSTLTGHDMVRLYPSQIMVSFQPHTISFGDFTAKRDSSSTVDTNFAFDAPTTKCNAMRVVRALQLNKPILLEGSPGVGKTTLVAALAKALGKPLTRINLSEQTDLMDLFGSDVPVEGAEAGKFAWRDAPFLQAMQRGDWVLLDEMNLASQSVLEGLNACLDHRGEVYISELDQTFKRHPNFSVFAAQNPHHQGGGRKGLPSSFVNRFTVVYADVFREDDLMLICKHNFPNMNETIMSDVISFVSTLEKEVVYRRKFGSQGGPWEFNLRDTLRWLHLLNSAEPMLSAGSPADFVNLIFRQRFRSPKDRLEVDRIFTFVFGYAPPFRHLFHNIAADAYQVGMAFMPRHKYTQKLPFPPLNLVHRLSELEAIMMCVQQNTPCILAGPSGSGKTTILRHVAAAAGIDLVVFPLNADIDTMDLVGGFEQVDPQRAAATFLTSLYDFLEAHVLSSLPEAVPSETLELLHLVRSSELSSAEYFADLSMLLDHLLQTTSVPGLERFVEPCRDFATSTRGIENARFEWVDGILVKALEEGRWLVLDNANLCSSSVLDRLNSLLEPNGVLIINEHSGPDGGPKLVKPHPNFRLFMTMDSRFGELSRAMRNRATEIYLEPFTQTSELQKMFHPVESQLQRFSLIVQVLEAESASVASHAVDNITGADLTLIDRFMESLPKLTSSSLRLPELLQMIKMRQESLDNGLGQHIAQLYSTLAGTSKFSESFRNAQTIHPLQNSPMVPLLQLASGTDRSYWLATILEIKSSMILAREAAVAQQAMLHELKPSRMNRLQRSIVAARVPAVANDSTVRVSGFLGDTLQQLDMYLQSSLPIEFDWKVHRRMLQNIIQFWWQTYSLTTQQGFEEATFQAHLAVGAEQLFKAFITPNNSTIPISQNSPHAMIKLLSKSLKHSFDSGFKLKSGLYMEAMWAQLRPAAISNQAMLQISLELKRLASRFDNIRWKISATAAELGNIINSLVRAFTLILRDTTVDAKSLTQSLDTGLTDLERKIAKEVVTTEPFFQSSFEALRQYKVIASPSLTGSSSCNPDLDVLSNFSTISLMTFHSNFSFSNSLPIIDHLYTGSSLKTIEDSFGAHTLNTLRRAEDVTLASLELLETEIPALGRQVTQMSGTLCQDQMNTATGLNSILCQLIKQVAAAVDPSMEQCFEQDLQKRLSNPAAEAVHTDSALTLTPEVDLIYSSYIRESINSVVAGDISIGSRAQHSSIAWVNFAVACIHLYVPDRSYDPDRRQRLQRERHLQISGALSSQIHSLKSFEAHFTGQSSNLRCQILEEDLRELGDPSDSLQEIYRPETSELDQLQGEFNNLLNAILQANPIKLVQSYAETFNRETAQAIELLQRNVSQIIQRLSERHPGYSDITTPAVGILRCLQIGLSITLMKPHDDDSAEVQVRTLSSLSPFLGGRPEIVSGTTGHTLEQLASISVAASVEGIATFNSGRLQSFLHIIHTCYEDWTKRLDTDRMEAESKTGLYRFRGSAEDEEEFDQEQFNELFPAYDDESRSEEEKERVHHTVRDTAVAVANVHAETVLGKRNPTVAIESLLKQIAKQIGHVSGGSLNFAGEQMTRNLLPGVLLSIDAQFQSLQSTSASSTGFYNFYTDANLAESRKLVALIYQIQSRYRELQEVDEIAHMQPLADVLISCRELLDFRYSEPIAKMITKVEKVHAYMHEWQFGGWASRANSAIALYDSLTQTIVSWRRLELATWAKLFDMENIKCAEDAKAWWFIAYQVVVAAPLGICESEHELKIYAQKLLHDLEAYFSGAVQGQFGQRLKLLKQLQVHLELLAQDLPLLWIVSSAVKNFLGVYIRYEKPVVESLKRGRATLEKTMKDILLLASWKDTNIVALRDSAKRSHYKLFKLVRKYRALLGQPMDTFINQALPDESEASVEGSVPGTVKLPVVDQIALAHCTSFVSGWGHKKKRFINISQTIGMMDEAVQFPAAAVNGNAYLESFLAEILKSTNELQRATPTVLTEDNKMSIKHLKSRKRKLFADTIKELRQMGIKHNLGTAALAAQESLSLVLSTTLSLSAEPGADKEYYYHKALDILPRARAATREHNEDLSKAEVIRSTGLLEGLLQVVVKQRNNLAAAVRDANLVRLAIAQTKALWAPESYSIASKSYQTTHGKMLSWLPNILKVALNLVKTHNKLGEYAESEVPSILQSWIEKFEWLAGQYQDLPLLPPNMTSTKHLEISEQSNEAVKQLSTDLAALSRADSHPELEFILGQILPWTGVEEKRLDHFHGDLDIAVLDETVSTLCDSVLSAIELFKRSVAQLPSSTEDAAWLVQEDQCLVNGILGLHSREVAIRVHKTFDVLARVDLADPLRSKSAAAIFAVSLPILQQYYNTLQDVISRYSAKHRSTCKLTYILAKTFMQIATQGFCTPSEKSKDQDGKTEKLEGGTGLGEGEGAEDISKDIQDDENLEDLAQESNKEEQGEIEDEQDAVDMADGEMEGEMGEAEEKVDDENDSGEESGEDEVDEEAGDVDDLDPNAVDEKMWDGDGEKAEKDQEGDESKGKAEKDEQVAAQDENNKGADGDEGDEGAKEEEEAAGAEQSEDVMQQDEIEKHDPHAKEEEKLDLPEDMDLDGEGNETDESVGSDEDMENLSDVNEEDEADQAEGRNDDKEAEDTQAPDQQRPEDLDVINLDEEGDSENPGDDSQDAGEKDETEAEPQIEEQEQDGLLNKQDNDANTDPENAVPSDAQGAGDSQEDTKDQDSSTEANQAQREEGGEGGDSTEQRDTAAEDGDKDRQVNGAASQDQNQEMHTSGDAQPFKQLGDALERWHRQQTKIRDSAEQQYKTQEQSMEADGQKSEFQHLQDENAEADAQALGTATEEQSHALDDSMAIDTETQDMPDKFQPEEVDDTENKDDGVVDIQDSEPQDQKQANEYDGRAGALVQQSNLDHDQDLEDSHLQRANDMNDDVEEVDAQLESTHIKDPALMSMSRSPEDARSLWTHYESLTRDLSSSLTEQLRLILAPTQATKMRGDFRTGKRLNIKRIIPYIASQYKRDKIWMRRSIPSKRSYQVMLAVDDSKSMGESGSGSLAFETLVMVSKSLSMLEVGEICVVGFGQDVRVAHEFDTPFSADAGPKIFQDFCFEQSRTDVTKLVRESIELFRTARSKASGSPTDLWQLQLIISDGVCDSSEHEPIRRLLREAIEERIMMVFVVVDDVKNKKKGESVMDLKEAKFIKNEMGNSEVKIERYLDTFPFQYYLIVSDVRELPGVLATLLRQWFAEVADSL